MSSSAEQLVQNQIIAVGKHVEECLTASEFNKEKFTALSEYHGQLQSDLRALIAAEKAAAAPAVPAQACLCAADFLSLTQSASFRQATGGASKSSKKRKKDDDGKKRHSISAEDRASFQEYMVDHQTKVLSTKQVRFLAENTSLTEKNIRGLVNEFRKK